MNHDSFLLPFPILTLFISFAYLSAPTRTSRTVHQSSNRGHPYLVSHRLIGFSNDLAQTVKHLPMMRETPVWSLGWEDPLEKEMATHSCLENFMHGGAWWAIVHGVKELDTTERLHSLSTYTNKNEVFTRYICPFLFLVCDELVFSCWDHEKLVVFF